MDEVRIPWVFDSRGVTKGAEEIEKAFDKVEKKGKSAMGDGASAGITDAALTKGLVRAERALKAHHAEMDREHKSFNQRTYQEAARTAEYRHAALVKSLRREKDAINSATGGGHGGGRSSGSGTRYAGDLINILTGSSGNVMRLNALSHSGLPIGAAAGGAALAGIGVLTAMGSAASQQYNSAGSANETARAGILGTNKATMFSGAAQGASGLSSQIEVLQAQAEKEGVANKAVAGVIQDRDRNFATRGFFGAIQRWKTSNFRGENKMPTPEEMLRESDQRGGVITRQMTLLRGQRGEAIGHEAATAQERFGGSSFQAKRMEIDMAEKAAEIEAAKQQLTAVEWEKKKETFAIQRKENEFEEQSAKVRADYAQEMAEFRGTAEQRTKHAMDAELVQAKNLLDLAKQKGNVEEIRDAKARADAASTARFYAQRDVRAEAAGRAAAVRAGSFGVSGAAARASLAYYGSNQASQFQSGQAISALGAQQNVGAAQLAVNAAREQAALHKGDAEYAKQAVLAQQNLTRSKLEQVDVDYRLRVEGVLRTRALQTELVAAQNVTAALRTANTGRADRAALQESRASTNAQALQFEREGRPDMAREVMEQQRQREIGLFDDKFLNPNGTRRSRFAINKEERMARLTEQRRGRANARLAGNLGMMDVKRDISGNVISGTDPLTREKLGGEAGPSVFKGDPFSFKGQLPSFRGSLPLQHEKLTAEHLFGRKRIAAQAAAEAAEDASPKVTNTRLGTIIQILQARLPAG